MFEGKGAVERPREVLISVAPVSAAPHKIIPEEIAEDVIRCHAAGAAMVHLHVRDENGRLTSDLSLTLETIRLIRERCDIIIEVSTGGVSDLTIKERCAPCTPDEVEANSLNVGSVNLGDAVYKNPIGEVRYCVEQIIKNGKFPEIEVFELGMIHTVWELTKEYPDFPRPLLFALVFGHPGEMPATIPALFRMRDFLGDTFKEEAIEAGKVLWGYTQAHRRDWEMMRCAVIHGADSLRVGFEDSDYLDPKTRVDRNEPIVAKAAEIVRSYGAVPMTAARAREVLRIG